MPVTGIFVIKPTSQDSGGLPMIDGSLAGPLNYAGWSSFPLVTVLDAVLLSAGLAGDQCQAYIGVDTIPVSLHDIVRFSFSGASIYLDGSLVPITFAGLPSGFTATAATVRIVVDAVTPPAVGTASFNLQQGPLTNGPANTADFPYDFTIPPTMLDILSNGCGIKVDLDGTVPPDVAAIAFVYNLRIEGTYEIQSYTFTVSPSPAQIGEDVTITSPDGGVPFILTDDGNGNSGIQIDYSGGTFIVPTTAIIFIDDTTLIFTLPVDFPVEETVEVFIVGTTFSGRVSAGNLDILLYGNVSGIYTLVPGKETDTIYRHDGTSTEVKIPNPFAKIGFIGS